MAKLPLENVRVADNTYTWAGPYATMMLADMGAEVIRVESIRRWQWNTRGFMARPSKELAANLGPLGGAYPGRDPGARPWNRHAMFNIHARNKLSMTVDLTQPKGVEIFHDLVKTCDLVVENSTPGVMNRLGIGYDDLVKVRPDLIMVSSSGLGATGPYAAHRGYGSMFQGMCGFTLLHGYPDSDPSVTPVTTHADAAAGPMMAFAAVAALHYRNRTGKGQYIDLAQSESLMVQMGEAIMDYTMNGRVQSTIANSHPSAAPHSVYPCRGEEKWVAICVYTDDQWRAFCRALGDPPWTKEPRFASSLGRWKNQGELDAFVAQWTRRHDPREIMMALQNVGVPAGAVMDEVDAFGDAHLWERGFFHLVTHAEAGTHWYPGSAWKTPATPVSFRRPPCRLGEHNEYVYKELLGCSEQEYGRLEAEGHVGMDFVPEIP